MRKFRRLRGRIKGVDEWTARTGLGYISLWTGSATGDYTWPTTVGENMNA